jgi:cytochrome c oxidase subunit 4
MTDTRRLALAWLGLMVLLAITAASAFLPLGWGNLAVNLAIAGAKTVLIGLVFMRLAGSPALLRLVVGAVFLWLAILFTLSLADFLTR